MFLTQYDAVVFVCPSSTGRPKGTWMQLPLKDFSGQINCEAPNPFGHLRDLRAPLFPLKYLDLVSNDSSMNLFGGLRNLFLATTALSPSSREHNSTSLNSEEEVFKASRPFLSACQPTNIFSSPNIQLMESTAPTDESLLQEHTVFSSVL